MTEAEPDWYGAEPQTPPRTWDFLLTVALTLLMIVLTIVLFVSSLSGGLFNAGCSNAAAECNVDLISIGHQICIWGPAIVAVIAVVWSFVRVLRRRIGFWVALLGLALMLGVFFVGQLLIDLGVPDTVTQ